MKKPKLVWLNEDLPFNVALYQYGHKDFRVEYGQEVHDHISYAEAARQLGLSIMHALTCEGRLK